MKRKFLQYRILIDGITAELFNYDVTKDKILTNLEDMDRDYGYEGVYADSSDLVYIHGTIRQDTKEECEAIYTLAKKEILKILKTIWCDQSKFDYGNLW